MQKAVSVSETALRKKNLQLKFYQRPGQVYIRLDVK
jgi:hypothetical protein